MNAQHWSHTIGWPSGNLHHADINVSYFFHGPLMMERWPEDPAFVRYYVPGTWCLCIVHKSGVDAFMTPNKPVCMDEVWAVVDDFGNLVRVQ